VNDAGSVTSFLHVRLREFLEKDSDIRHRLAHYRLKKDLVLYICNKFGRR
jgi:hypothetical protein